MRSENTAKRLLDFLMKCPCNYVGHLQFCGVIDHSTAEWATVAFSDGWLPISGWHWQQHNLFSATTNVWWIASRNQLTAQRKHAPYYHTPAYAHPHITI